MTKLDEKLVQYTQINKCSKPYDRHLTKVSHKVQHPVMLTVMKTLGKHVSYHKIIKGTYKKSHSQLLREGACWFPAAWLA